LSLIVREEHESRVFEKGVLRIIFGPEREEVIARERKFIMRSFIISRNNIRDAKIGGRY
jgi:hypothetical protein